MRSISIVNTKGGVGKTTTAVYLATALAAQYRVILLDADPQGSATSWATDAFEAGDQLDFEVRPANAPIVRRCRDIDADLVIIDTPPGDSQTITAALDVADVVIIPTESGGPGHGSGLDDLSGGPRHAPGLALQQSRLDQAIP